MKTTTKFWIAIAALAFLSPLGVIVPALFGAGGAWGEWKLAELKRMAGFVPAEMKRLAELWKAPLPDYAVPGQAKGLASGSLGYVLAALVGLAVTAAVVYGITRLFMRKREGDGR